MSARPRAVRLAPHFVELPYDEQVRRIARVTQLLRIADRRRRAADLTFLEEPTPRTGGIL